jgi:hypothetical protein
MEAIGGVSAILGVAQLGFTLAGTLVGFISDIQGAKASINGIQEDVEGTAACAGRLGNLIANHDKQPCFSPQELEAGKRVLLTCETVFLEIRKLLLDTGSKEKPTDQEIALGTELEVRWSKRLTWPVLKQRLVEPRSHLEVLRSRMTLLYTGVSLGLQ